MSATAGKMFNELATYSQFYMKDGEGSTYSVDLTLYKDKLLYHGQGIQIEGLNNLQTFQLKDEDVLIMSFPKSGTHWLHEIISILLSGKLEHNTTPTIDGFLEHNSRCNVSNDFPEPRIYLTHLLKEFLPDHIFAKPKIIYVIRNPKSVAASRYSHMKRKTVVEYEGTFKGFFPVFMKGMYSIWGNWFQHVTEYWKTMKDSERTHFVFFEELKLRPLEEVMKLSKFLGCNHSEAFCEEVVRMTSIEQMRDAQRWRPSFDFYGVEWKSGQDGIVREGNIDGWQSCFTAKENIELQRRFDEELKEYPELRERIKFC